MTATTKPRCEAHRTSGEHKCRKLATGRANGLDVCAEHKRRIDKTFADARQRWRDAGEPESDL